MHPTTDAMAGLARDPDGLPDRIASWAAAAFGLVTAVMTLRLI